MVLNIHSAGHSSAEVDMTNVAKTNRQHQQHKQQQARWNMHLPQCCLLTPCCRLDIASLFMICRWLIRISDLLRSLCHGRIMEKVDFLSLVKRGSMMMLNLPLFMKNYQSMPPHKSGSGPCEYKASIFGLFRLNLSLDPAA